MNIYKSFIPDQFCVYHTTYSGTLMPSNYIGSSSVDKVINKSYRGSVSSKKYKNIWLSELKLHPELFNTEIISYHDTRHNATWKELQIQRIFNVVKNPIFINMSYASPHGYFGMDNSGITLSDEHKKKQSDAAKRRPPLSMEIRLKISIAKKGNITSEETKLKQSVATKGKPKGPQTIVVCPHCTKPGAISNMKRWHFDNCKTLILPDNHTNAKTV